MSIQGLESVQVTIFNQTYSLRAHTGGGERVRYIARLVDERMRNISAHLTTHDIAKVAILAALNIADELQQLKETQGAEGENSLKATEAGGSWFDDIFDSAEPARDRDKRLSSQVSARLQTLRRPNQGEYADADDEGQP